MNFHIFNHLNTDEKKNSRLDIFGNYNQHTGIENKINLKKRRETL